MEIGWKSDVALSVLVLILLVLVKIFGAG